MNDVRTRKGHARWVVIDGKIETVITMRTDWKATAADRLNTMALQRKQLRNAWAKLECRCIFNDQDEKTHEDEHCPYHGFDQMDPDAWDPIGELRRELAEANHLLSQEREEHIFDKAFAQGEFLRLERKIEALSREHPALAYALRDLEEVKKERDYLKILHDGQMPV